jgi:hypothetical protein
MYEGMEIQLHAFLASALGGCEWLASFTGCFTPEDTTLMYIEQEIGGGSQSRFGCYNKKKNQTLIALPGVEPQSPACRLVALLIAVPTSCYIKTELREIVCEFVIL